MIKIFFMMLCSTGMTFAAYDKIFCDGDTTGGFLTAMLASVFWLATIITTWGESK